MHHKAALLRTHIERYPPRVPFPHRCSALETGEWLLQDRLSPAQLNHHHVHVISALRGAAVGGIIPIPACLGNIRIKIGKVQLGDVPSQPVNAEPCIQLPKPSGFAAVFAGKRVIHATNATDHKKPVSDIVYISTSKFPQTSVNEHRPNVNFLFPTIVIVCSVYHAPTSQCHGVLPRSGKAGHHQTHYHQKPRAGTHRRTPIIEASACSSAASPLGVNY